MPDQLGPIVIMAINAVTAVAVVAVAIVYREKLTTLLFPKRLPRGPDPWREPLEERGWRYGGSRRALKQVECGELKLYPETHQVGNNNQRVTYLVLEAPAPQSISITTQSWLATLGQAVMNRDLQIGDPAFDEAFLLRGPEDQLRAWLTLDTRKHIAQMIDGPGKVTQGRIKFMRRVSRLENLLPMLDILDAYLEDLQAFQTEPPAERLAFIARSDPSPKVALQAGRLLMNQFPEQAQKEAEYHILSPNASLRLAAAKVLHDQAVIGVIVADSQAPLGVRQQALEALEPTDSARGSYTAALRDDKLRESAIRVLARVEPWPDLHDAWERVMQVAPVGEVAMAVLALKAKRGAHAEEHYRAALVRGGEAMMEAAGALAQHGSVESVAALREAEKRAGMYQRATISQAIGTIQSRAGGEGGGLALADEQSGQLSEAQAKQAGQLSTE